MSGGWPGLPPIDVAGWGNFQRTRLQQYGKERIAGLGAVASDWGSEAQRRIDEITGRVGEAAAGIQAALPGGAGWEADLDRIRQEAQASEQQFPTPEPTGPAGFTLPQTGTPEGEAITSALAETATRETPGGAFMTNAARSITGNPPPMTADTPAQNIGTMAGLAFQNIGAPLPGGRAIVGGVLPQAAARGVAEAIPGGETSVLEGMELPAYSYGPGGARLPVPFGGQTLTRDTPFWGGLTTPDVAAPLAAEVVAGEPEDILRTGRGALGAAAGVTGDSTAWARNALDDLARRYGTPPQEALGIVNAKTYDPTGIDPVQGRLAGRGAPGRAPGPALLGPITPEAAAKIPSGRYGAAYEGPPLSADPIPPGPGPNGEYTIPHPHGYDMVAPPPEPGTYLSSDGFIFWQRVAAGESPYRADYEESVRGLAQPKYPWDTLTNPPPAPGTPGYGRMDQSPLPAPDWDTKLAGWAPRRGTDPVTLRHLLNRYAMHERFPQEAINDLAPSHPDLAGPEARAAAEADLNEALTRSGARRSKNEDRAIASERNVRKAPGEGAEEGAAGTGDGAYSYTSTKGVGPDGEKEFHFTSSYEVATAIKLDQDPTVVSWQKGSGPRGRVRLVIDPKYGYDPTSESLKANSDPGPGSEVIYSPDFLAEFADRSQKVIETKNVGIYNLPAWRIEAKTTAGQRHFEDLWGVGFMMMAEDQLGRPFLRELATADVARLPAGHPLRRVRPGDLADLQKKLLSAAKASRGGENDPMLMDAAQHLMDLNASSKYPASATLDDTHSVQQYLSAARAQAEWHNQTGPDGTTFSVDGQNIPLAPGLGGYMVSVTPPWQRLEYPTHRIDPYRLAQFRHENAHIFAMDPEARVGTFKGTDPTTGKPITYVDVSIRVPDGQAAAEVANLFRQRFVYNIDRSTNLPVARPERQWVGQRVFDEKGAHERLKRTLAEAAARAERGAAVPDFPEFRGLPAEPGGAPTPRGPARPRAGAARGRGAVPGVPGAEPGAARGSGGLGGTGDVESVPGGGAPPAAAPGLPVDGRGSGDLGGPGGAGITAQPGGRRGALDAALASLQPYGAAATRGQRAFDVATGTAGGITSAATAEEDATWQERAKRFALGAAAGSLVGPTARGALGQVAGRSVNDEVLGAAAARSRLSPQEALRRALGGGPGGAPPTPSRGAAGPQLGAPPTPAPSGLRARLGRVGPSDIPSIMASLPLASPSSLGANLTGGAVRTLERVLGKALEGRPIEALVDAATMAKTVPGALKRAGGNIAAGPTAKAPGLTGAPVKDDLATRAGIVPTALSIGTRVNAATDEFWRELNAAGAGAAARRRGMGLIEAADYRNAAGDFATFGGGNTQVAKKLTEMKASLHDPDAGMLDKSIAWGVTAMAPYIMMPERLLRASIGTLAPVGQVTGAVKAFRRGDKAAARELAGRAAVAIPAWVALAQLYDQGALTGPPPEDANERRRLEAQGAQWETVEVPGGGKIPLRYLGSFGQSASAFASIMDAAKKAEADGADPGAVWEARGDELMRWTLEESYLSDLIAFGEDVGGGRGVQSLRRTAAGLPSRFTAPVAGVLSAKDPYEREAETLPEMVAMRAGGRESLRPRLDPTTGEPQRRRGSGWTRYWGERGSEQTPEAQELARRGLQPRTFGPAEEYAGTRQTPEQRRLLQQAFGSETGKALRETTASKAYQQADEEGKEQLLQASLRRAAEEADLVAGERVGRDAKSKAQLEWQAVPRYEDVKGAPDQVRRLNARIRRIKSELAAAIKADPNKGEQTFLRERREDYRLADQRGVDADDLRAAREKIEAKYGVELS